LAVLVLVFTILALQGQRVSASASDIEIEAEGSVNFDIDKNITTATKKVKLVNEKVTIEAEELTYDGNTGLAIASGGVKLTTKNSVIESETLHYNVKDSTGTSDTFSGTVSRQASDYKISGTNFETSDEVLKLNGSSLTKCPRPKPDYLLRAKIIKITDQKTHLEKATLYVKGIPVFYFPSLTFNNDGTGIPQIDVAYNDTVGLKVKGEYSAPVNDNLDLRFRGDLSTKGNNKLGIGTDLHGGGVSNRTDVLYDFSGFWTVEDRFAVNTPLFLFVLDGSREFSSLDRMQLGFSATRKYWDSRVGSWQFGVLARRVSVLDSSLTDYYGGTYGGFRLDYRPYQYMTLSLLRLNSFNGGDYRDFLADYKIGSNFLYDATIPINQEFSFGVNGAYNFDQDEQERWIHRIFEVTRETCCFSTSVGWDAAMHSYIFGWRIKF
jgi:hypothetical protein